MLAWVRFRRSWAAWHNAWLLIKLLLKGITFLVLSCLVLSFLQTVHMQAKEIQLALRSGVHSSVAWSLNALTVLSFGANPPLLLFQHPGLLDALLQAWHSSLAAGS